jgi:hypothetical protein
LSERNLQGLGTEVEDEVAEIELGLAESVGFVGGSEQTGDVKQVFFGDLAEQGEELLGLSFLFGGQGTRHGGLRGARRWISRRRIHCRFSVQKFH